MSIRTLIILLAAVAALAACGRRGDLQPPGTPETTAIPAEPMLRAEPAQAPPEPPPPERRFFLDPLI
jgi:predicted small lipoprotein YifL